MKTFIFRCFVTIFVVGVPIAAGCGSKSDDPCADWSDWTCSPFGGACIAKCKLDKSLMIYCDLDGSCIYKTGATSGLFDKFFNIVCAPIAAANATSRPEPIRTATRIAYLRGKPARIDLVGRARIAALKRKRIAIDLLGPRLR
jgi:hypothetical protein